jgi:hypothetical protein
MAGAGETPSKYDIGWFTDADDLGKQQGLGARNDAVVKQALALIQDFQKRSGSGEFKELDRAKVAAGVAARLRNPDSFNQGGTWLCGIATVVRTWAFDHPVEYAQFAIDLFEKGAGKMQGHSRYSAKSVQPSAALKASPPAAGVDQGDWIVLASVREAFNDVFDYTADEGIFRIKAWNFPSDVEREFKALGYTRIISKATPFKSAGYDRLMEASELYERDWRVILLINSRLLDKKDIGQNAVINHSDHWIGLNSPITVSLFNGQQQVFPFQVYSWNGLYKVPRWDRPVALRTVLDSYFGFVAGQY